MTRVSRRRQIKPRPPTSHHGPPTATVGNDSGSLTTLRSSVGSSGLWEITLDGGFAGCFILGPG